MLDIHGDQNENERIDTDITETQQWKVSECFDLIIDRFYLRFYSNDLATSTETCTLFGINRWKNDLTWIRI